MSKSSMVAGAAGFLGSNLVAALLEKGHEVIGFDNFATSHRWNLDGLLDKPGFTFMQASVLEPDSWPDVRRLDYVFHLASPASPPLYQKLGLETVWANTIGTERLARLAINANARLVYASTSEVYGDPLVSPQQEGYFGNVNPIGPRAVYDESKRLGETIVRLLQEKESLNAGIVRIFNTYGPKMDPDDGRVMSTFIRQALQGDPLTVFGDGSQTRSFCYVDDLISGLILMAESSSKGPINLGNPNEMDLVSLGRLVGQTLGKSITFDFGTLPQDDPVRRCPDISLAVKELSWAPKVEAKEGIQRTAEWMSSLLSLRAGTN